ncbi:MAG: methylmalonyl Co-A mutase-associated GTPase MeaB [Desulfohalobiaceae bacterium]
MAKKENIKVDAKMDVVQKVRSGDIRIVSRLIRNIEDKQPRAKEAIKSLYPYTGQAHVIGLTGPPGAGKSTISDSLITAYREQGKSVGVLAVDPTSPFTGGALLGDRVRMQKHAEDQGVFIRSLATRGALGGLCDAVDDAIHVLDAMGKEIILVETVGIGQSEVDIMNNAQTVVLVLTPGLGDEVQTIKAGVMEVADLFLVNKADQPGAAKLLQELRRALDMAQELHGVWKPPVLALKSIAQPKLFQERVQEIREKIDEHYGLLLQQDMLKEREKRKYLVQLQNALRVTILDPLLNRLSENGELEDMLIRLVQKEIDPYSLAEELAASYLAKAHILEDKGT